MKKLGFEIIRHGSVNGKIVALLITVFIFLFYLLGAWIKGLHDAAVDYGSRLNEAYAIAIGAFFLKQVGQPAAQAIAKAISYKIKGKKTGEIPEEEGDA